MSMASVGADKHYLAMAISLGISFHSVVAREYSRLVFLYSTPDDMILSLSVDVRQSAFSKWRLDNHRR